MSRPAACRLRQRHLEPLSWRRRARGQAGASNSPFCGSSTVDRVPLPTPMTKRRLAHLPSPSRCSRREAASAQAAVRRAARHAAVAEGPPLQRGRGHADGRPRASPGHRRRGRLRLELVPALEQQRSGADGINGPPNTPPRSGARVPGHAVALPVDARTPAARGATSWPSRRAWRSAPASTRPTASTSASRSDSRRRHQSQNDISQQRNIGGAADMRLDILPERPLGAAIYANYARVIQPNHGHGRPEPLLQSRRHQRGRRDRRPARQRHARLALRLPVPRHASSSRARASPSTTSRTRATRAAAGSSRPRTALIYDASLGFISYQNPQQALASEGLVNSDAGAHADRHQRPGHGAASRCSPWSAGARASTTSSDSEAQPQYDSVIGQAELKWFLSAGPGMASPADVGLALSSSPWATRATSRTACSATITAWTAATAVQLLLRRPGSGDDRGRRGRRRVPDHLCGRTAPLRAQLVHRPACRRHALRRVPIHGRVRHQRDPALHRQHQQHADPARSRAFPTRLFDMSWNRFEAFLGVRYFL